MALVDDLTAALAAQSAKIDAAAVRFAASLAAQTPVLTAADIVTVESAIAANSAKVDALDAAVSTATQPAP